LLLLSCRSDILRCERTDGRARVILISFVVD
jgi:hypothetical protein